ncbi:MAG: DUF2306 domain-containing protein, partial [Gemmataceae bacterium]
HRRWMFRTTALLSSAIVLRLVSGGLGLLGIEDAETAYIAVAWASWMIPLLALETWQRLRAGQRCP